MNTRTLTHRPEAASQERGPARQAPRAAEPGLPLFLRAGEDVEVQRQESVPAVTPPAPTIALPPATPPPVDAGSSLLDEDARLTLDPETLALMRTLLIGRLAPLTLRLSLRDSVDAALLGLPPPAAGEGSAGIVTQPIPPAPDTPPLIDTTRGTGPDTPRAGEGGDVADALLAAADPALTRLGDMAVSELEQGWSAASTPEQVGLVGFGVGLGSLLGYGLYASPEARGFALDQLNGMVIPVPGAGWMGMEMYTGGDQLMLGVHLDVGRLLPEALGFGEADYNAIGGAPVPTPFVPGQLEAEGGDLPDVPADAGQRIAAARDGAPLPEATREKLEAGLGADLSAVRIHTDGGADALARDLAAEAFTSGQHIFLRSGNYRPDTDGGLRLLAHETAHTVQQASGPVGGVNAGGGVALSRPGDSLEREAHAAANRVLDGGAGASLSVATTHQVSRDPKPGGAKKGLKEAPDANALLTASQPHLLKALSKEQIDNLQRYYDSKANTPVQPLPVQCAPEGSLQGMGGEPTSEASPLPFGLDTRPQPGRLDPARRLEDLMRAESILHTAREAMDDIHGILIPNYLAARDALDVAALGEAGGRLLAAYAALHGARAALGGLHARAPRMSARDTALEDDLALASVLHGLDAALPELDAKLPRVDAVIADAFVPHRFSGIEVTGGAAAPAITFGESGRFEDQMLEIRMLRLEYELRRTFPLLETARQVRTRVLNHLSDTTPKRPEAPDRFITLTPRGPLGEARALIEAHTGRPIDMAFLRVALGALWDVLYPVGPGPCTVEPTGPLAEAARQAAHTGWLGEVGRFDIYFAETMLRFGGRDNATPVLNQLYSADPDTRARLLMRLKQRGLTDRLYSAFGWAEIKALHDSLGGGFGEIKSDLQRGFIGSGKWGPSLGSEWEQHDLSASGWFSRNLGFVGRGINKVLDAGSFGFYGSYSDAVGAESQGLISSGEARAAKSNAGSRAIVIGAAALLTGGVADKLVRGGAATVGTARAFAAGAAGGGASAISGLAAGDVYNIHVAGTQSEFSSLSDYVQAALLGGALGGTYQGARQFRANRAGAGTPAAPPGASPVPAGTTEVTPAEVRATWAREPDLVKKSLTNEFHQQQWERHGGTGPAPIAFRFEGAIRVNEVRWLAVGDLAEINFAADLRPLPGGARGAALADTLPQGVPVDPMARTLPQGVPVDPMARTQPAPAGSRSTALSLPPSPAPRGYSPVHQEVAAEAHALNPHAVIPSWSNRFHQMVWEYGGGQGRAPLAYRVGSQIRVDFERWPVARRAEIGL